ncbi:protein FAM234A-like, partial [Saccostrea cucullata]|uniref:protein FAM234A-like n=1 Tax=Saccostrea cuccullata TaxID=36930 RepID=UPI002ED3BB74
MSKSASKNGYDRVPLVSATHSDSEDDTGPVSYIALNKRYRQRSRQKPLIVVGFFIIIMLLSVIAAMCYVLVRRSDTTSGAITTPTGAKFDKSGQEAEIATTKRADENLKPQTPNWKVTFKELGTESVMRLIDIDGDGLQDVVFGAASTADLEAIIKIDSNGSLWAFCNASGRIYPCIGTLIGMRGYDGNVLWKVPTRSGAMLNNCEDFDLNLDGNIDCVIGGRSAMMEAVDVRNGKHLWEASSPFFKKKWNFYQAMALPDFNGDGVKEILVMHGGDPSIESD